MNNLERGQGILKEFNLNSDVASRALDLSSEVGELCKEILKGTKYSSSDFKTSPNLELELGDVMVSRLLLAPSAGFDLDVALENSPHKICDRLRSSSSRDLSGEGN